MILPKYPSYQDSGVPWLGKIPSGWHSNRGKRLFIKMERPVEPEDEVITCFRDGVVTLRKNRRLRGFTESIKEFGYQGIRKGDLVIHQMDGFAGAIGVSDSDGKGTPVYSVCRPLLANVSEYYAYLLREMARSNYILSLAKGIRERSTDFRFETFAKLILPVPPHEEQKQIARYLDWKTVQIGKFIRNKRQLIALLKEQKQNLIHHAVTRGLDPDAPTKPSGIEWLVDIPEHWEVRRIKQVVMMNPSRSERAELRKSENKVVFLPMEKISVSGDIDCSERRSVKDVWNGFTYFAKDDVVLAKITPCFENGKSAFLNELQSEFGFGTTELLVMRPRHQIKGAFLREILNNPNFLYLGGMSMTGAAGQQRVSSSFVKEFQFALPTLDEQQAILTHVEKHTVAIDAAVARAEREIELIGEYRTRLIADVVTGQVDVRHIKVPEGDWSTENAESTEDDTEAIDEEPELEEVEL